MSHKLLHNELQFSGGAAGALNVDLAGQGQKINPLANDVCDS
jgi:hypothetical protein